MLVASLAETLTRAVALGDEMAARVVHEAIGQLLGAAPAPESSVSPRRQNHAYRRREVTLADPHRVAEQQAPSPHRLVEARHLLKQLRLMPMRTQAEEHIATGTNQIGDPD
ncbi:hypothetical protein [Sorangium sp. So ce1151]|uniref:hypothetical protein n=1 Tax=Sorangium sp. So ce1151 TaxID=3133332 RepID=UPI003F60792B